jgi:gamma-butyrobetaine dioxygenase
MAPATSKRFFQAYHAFASLIQESTDLLVEQRLHPGQVLCFNNRRMLHGRRAFGLQNGAVRHLKVRPMITYRHLV